MGGLQGVPVYSRTTRPSPFASSLFTHTAPPARPPALNTCRSLLAVPQPQDLLFLRCTQPPIEKA